jgi:hypothetical protein
MDNTVRERAIRSTPTKPVVVNRSPRVPGGRFLNCAAVRRLEKAKYAERAMHFAVTGDHFFKEILYNARIYNQGLGRFRH